MLRYVCKYLHVSLKIDEYYAVNKLNQGVLLANKPFHSQDLISNSPYCLTYNSYDVS